ncbi:MAG: ArnT family glycosyltransferase [Thermogutta sp.]
MATTLAFYAIVTCLGAVARRDQINPDGIAYIRNAVYLTEGRWFDSVSGYWSPLLSWSLAPFMYFGYDGLHASRAVLGVWGAVLVIGVWVFIGRCTALTFPWNVVVLMLVGLAAAQWTISVITPDVLLGALLLWYFVFTARPDVLSSRRTQILAGAFGGLAYLAKSYAFPFFVAHYSLTVLLYFALRRQNTRAWDALKAWAIGFIAFALIAGPWVGVLSSKYGRFTFSTVAASAHNLVGPPEVANRNDVLHRAQTVPPGRITIWETPENVSFKDWSPFASLAFLKHQVEVVKRNCRGIVRAIADFDLLALVPGFLFLMPAIRLAASRRGAAEVPGRYPAAWSLMTIIVYAGGFLPIYFEARYIEPVLWPICCISVFGVLSDAGRLVPHDKPAPSILLVLSALCVLSFAAHCTGIAKSAISTVVRTAMRPASPYRSPYRECGDKLAALGCGGPVAACEGCWATGLYVSYHASLPFLGEIGGLSPAAVEESLEQSGARVFVANGKWALLENFAGHTKWQRVCTSGDDGGEDTISVFLAPEREVRSPNIGTPGTVAGQKD